MKIGRWSFAPKGRRRRRLNCRALHYWLRYASFTRRISTQSLEPNFHPAGAAIAIAALGELPVEACEGAPTAEVEFEADVDLGRILGRRSAIDPKARSRQRQQKCCLRPCGVKLVIPRRAREGGQHPAIAERRCAVNLNANETLLAVEGQRVHMQARDARAAARKAARLGEGAIRQRGQLEARERRDVQPGLNFLARLHAASSLVASERAFTVLIECAAGVEVISDGAGCCVVVMGIVRCAGHIEPS